MTIEYAIDGTPLAASAVLINPDGAQGFPSAAWYCDPMVADLRIDDPDGDYELEGWHTFTVSDDADADRPRIFTGWIVGLAHGRGNYRDGPGRVWEVQIADHNSALQLEVFRSTAASVRPAETDVTRVLSAITSHAQAGTPVVDNGRVATDHPLNIDASNFVTQHPSDMIVSAAGQTNNNAYVYWDHAAEELALHYDTVGEGPAAQISVSNVPGDYDQVDVFPPFVDARKETDTAGLATGVLLLWTGGATYARNQTLIDSLSPTDLSPSEFLRDAVVNSSRIGRATTAAAYIQTQLAIYSVPRHTLTWTLRLPASKHNAIQAGDVVNVRFSHLVGYETSTPVAVIKVMKRPTDGRVDMYDIDYEAADFGTAVGAGGGGTGGFPTQGGCEEDNITLVDTWMDTAPGAGDTVDVAFGPVTAGNLLILNTTFRGLALANPIAGWTLSPLETTQRNFGGDTSSNAIYLRVADGTETNVQTEWDSVAEETRGHVSEWTGLGLDIVDSGFGSTDGSLLMVGGEVTVPTGAVVLVYTAIAYNEGGDIWPYPDPVWTTAFSSPAATVLGFNKDEGGNHPVQVLGYQVTTGTGATIQHSALADFVNNGDESGNGQTLVIRCIGGTVPPLPGQPVQGETPGGTVDGSNDEFTTANPAADGSLRVEHDGINQTDHVTDYDLATNTVTLDYAPSAGSELRVDYQVHP